MKNGIAHIGARSLDGYPLNHKELMKLIKLGTDDPNEMFYWAHRIRRARFGSAVSFCSIIPARLGGCTEDCAWCGQSARSCLITDGPHKTSLDVVAAAVKEAVQSKAECFCIVNSGRKQAAVDFNDVIAAFGELSGITGKTHLSASLGELTDVQAEHLAAVGVRRYNHNLETSNRYYPNVVSTHSYADRLRTLEIARSTGLELCCGGIFGIGETWEDRVELAITLRDKVHPQVIPLNFLHPIPGTPLEGATPMQPLEILMTVALFRIAMPCADLKIAGGRVNLRDLQSWVFYAGATSCIKGNYLTTMGRPVEDDLQMIDDLGLQVVQGFDSNGTIFDRSSLGPDRITV